MMPRVILEEVETNMYVYTAEYISTHMTGFI